MSDRRPLEVAYQLGGFLRPYCPVCRFPVFDRYDLEDGHVVQKYLCGALIPFGEHSAHMARFPCPYEKR